MCLGLVLCARLGSVDQWPEELEGRLEKWNCKSERPEASDLGHEST